MALKLDEDLLIQLGLASLSAEDKGAMLQQIRDTLEMRVGTRLAGQMSDQQLDEFEQFVNNQDDAGALRWLETNFPNYKDVVNEEFDKLRAEIKQAAPEIMASSSASANNPPSTQPGAGNPSEGVDGGNTNHQPQDSPPPQA